MSGNLFSIDPHSTLAQKVKNFPENVYSFNEGDNLTTLMTILLGNSGTGQLKNLQTAARIGQQYIEYSNLDTILGDILHVSRVSNEIYSFPTNPFLDQLTDAQWQEVIHKDAAYRERLLGTSEAYQIGPTLWGVLTLAEALTQLNFYVVESWRTSGYGRNGVNKNQEIVLIPMSDTVSGTGGLFNWDQSKVNAILNSIQSLTYGNFEISFAKNPIKTFSQVSGTYVAASGYSEYYHLPKVVSANTINTPSNIPAGGSTRYWLSNNSNNLAPYFSHLQTQEISIDVTGNISSASTSDLSELISNSIAPSSLSVTATIYGAQ